MFQVFLFFHINKTQGHTMNLGDLLNVELYNDKLKMFSQGWEETSPAHGSVSDERVLVMLYERQVKKSTLMKHAMTLISARHCSEKGAEKLPMIEHHGHLRDARAAAAEHVEFSHRVSKRQSSRNILVERSRRKRQRSSISDVERLLLEEHNMFFRT